MKEKTYNEKILANLRLMFANSLYNQKINQNASNRLNAYSKRLFLIGVSCLSLYLLINFGRLDELCIVTQNIPPLILGLFKALLGVTSIALMIIQHWGQFNQRSIRHENTAKQYRGVRDDLLSLISDYMSGLASDSEVIPRRDSIKKEIDVIDSYALSTKSCDYSKAQKNLRGKAPKGEHFTFSNEEIDRHLPEELRIAQMSE